MNPINHPNCTNRLAKPKNWDDSVNGECSSLPISIEIFDAIRFMCSYWKPTPQELAALNAGYSVKLGISGNSHPVVFIGVEE